jgi:hypothetical protein
LVNIHGRWIRSGCAWNIGRSNERIWSKCVPSCAFRVTLTWPRSAGVLITNPYFYRQLSRRARRIYLFREEYIFDVEKAVVVETPQLGHATYVFSKPRNMDSFLSLYTKITKDDIRRNRNNAAERLGFLGRVIHGTNPRAWLKEVRQRAGEGIDFAAATAE